MAKAQAVSQAIALLTQSAGLCRKAGHAIGIVSCGGTGTFPFCIQQPGVTEVQVGGATFNDEHYRTHYGIDFPCALTIAATVTSRPTPTRIIVDAGRKAMSYDAASPRVLIDGVRELKLSAEHTTLELDVPSETPAIGDVIHFAVGYSDTTVPFAPADCRHARRGAGGCVARRRPGQDQVNKAAPLSVADARTAMLGAIVPLSSERVALISARGRVLTEPVVSIRDQPPFAVSAMDGYAIRAADAPGALRVIGESKAGAGFEGVCGKGEAVRISTGASIPQGADTVVVQEDVRRDGDTVEVPAGDGECFCPRTGW